MAQHDYVIANGTGAAVRSDLNNALAAIVTQNSGATAPATTYAYQWWADTTTGLLKIRNAANNAWVTIGSLSTAGFGLLAAGDTLTAALGSASTPGITFTGDLNTGIYSPGADQVAISTNGSGRLFVDSSGRVIIGAATAAIGNTLEIVSNSIALALGVRGRSADNIGIIGFYPNNSSTEYARIQSNGDSSLSFGTGSSGTERMRLTSTGLGIGTTSPAAPLNVETSTDGPQNLLYLRNTNSSGTNDTCKITLGVVGTAGTGTCGIWAGKDSDHSTAANVDTHLAFSTTLNDLESERARIDSSGRLLIGTSSAFDTTTVATNYQVGLEKAGSYSAFSLKTNANTDEGAYITLGKSRGTTANSKTVVNNGDTLGAIAFEGADGASMRTGAQIQAYVDGTPGSGDLPCRLVFSTTADGASSPTERMRINNDGKIFAGAQSSADFVTADTARLNIKSPSSMWALKLYREGTGAATVVSIENGNGQVGSITTNGSSTAFNTSSDYRLKENVIPVADSITRLQQLKPSRFNFITDPDKTVDGFIAHEVQTVVPEAITGEKDAVDVDGNPIYQGIDQSKLVPLLTAALQELVVEVEGLKAEVAALKAA